MKTHHYLHFFVKAAIVAVLVTFFMKANDDGTHHAPAPSARANKPIIPEPEPEQDLCQIIKKGMSSKEVIAMLGKERQVTFDRVDGVLFTLEYCPKGWGSCRNAVFSSKTKIVKEVECADGSRKKLI